MNIRMPQQLDELQISDGQEGAVTETSSLPTFPPDTVADPFPRSPSPESMSGIDVGPVVLVGIMLAAAAMAARLIRDRAQTGVPDNR